MRDIIAAGLADLGLLDRVPGQAPSQLAEYGHLLLEKNQVMNLTAITDPVKVAQLHMLDCAALLTCADFENRALLDVGTGAGFPGLPLKILVPSLQVTLLDSLNKRVDWLAQVSAQLSLTGIRVIHARAEEQALEKGFRDSFELVTARAVAELRLLCELCLPYVKVGGAFLAMKSVDCGRELEEAAGRDHFGTGLTGELRGQLEELMQAAGEGLREFAGAAKGLLGEPAADEGGGKR